MAKKDLVQRVRDFRQQQKELANESDALVRELKAHFYKYLAEETETLQISIPENAARVRYDNKRNEFTIVLYGECILSEYIRPLRHAAEQYTKHNPGVKVKVGRNRPPPILDPKYRAGHNMM